MQEDYGETKEMAEKADLAFVIQNFRDVGALARSICVATAGVTTNASRLARRTVMTAERIEELAELIEQISEQGEISARKEGREHKL